MRHSTMTAHAMGGDTLKDAIERQEKALLELIGDGLDEIFASDQWEDEIEEYLLLKSPEYRDAVASDPDVAMEIRDHYESHLLRSYAWMTLRNATDDIIRMVMREIREREES